MRGLPPLVVALLGATLFDEPLSLAGWTAIAILVAGVLLLGWDSLRRGSLTRVAARYVGLQIAIIATYTLVDGSGVRASGNALAYIAWMFVLTAAVMALAARASFVRLTQEGPRSLGLAMAGGLFTFGSYAVALWAMTRAPVALVAALRETSILFGAALGAWMLRERFGVHRWCAVGLILGGVAGMRLA
jgi:drug/metabolite transporter (DMT)-like permease